MKHILLFILFWISTWSFGQQMFFEVGSTISAFEYKNSQGESLENLQSKSSNYLVLGYRRILNNNQTLALSIALTYNGYGAIGSDRTLDNYFEWDVNYAGLSTGLDYRLFRIRDFSFFVKSSLSVEFLIRGNQTINNQVYNLVGEDEFNNNIFFTRGHFFVQYPISRNTSIQAGYSYGKTVLIGKGGSQDNETLKLNTHQIGIGLIINLPNCNCSF